MTIIPDFLWRERARRASRPTAERWHEHKLTREHDADKQAILEGHGWRVVRVDYEQARATPASRRSRASARRWRRRSDSRLLSGCRDERATKAWCVCDAAVQAASPARSAPSPVSDRTWSSSNSRSLPRSVDSIVPSQQPMKPSGIEMIPGLARS